MGPQSGSTGPPTRRDGTVLSSLPPALHFSQPGGASICGHSKAGAWEGKGWPGMGVLALLTLDVLRKKREGVGW
jgi:hypothetical protein